MEKPIEEMRAFFTERVDGYDEHMMQNVLDAEGYARGAALLPEETRTLLDLGCGTGLQLEAVFARFPGIAVTGVDLTQAMLDALKAKHPEWALRLICGDYFQVDFGDNRFDAAISYESLHHFTHDEKRGLYRRVLRALRPGGVYVEADYVAATQAEEEALFARREELLSAQGAGEGLWHFDTPCTVESQLRLLREAGFRNVALDMRWAENSAVLVARKEG